MNVVQRIARQEHVPIRQYLRKAWLSVYGTNIPDSLLDQDALCIAEGSGWIPPYVKKYLGY
jgi:hypothetical protein